MNKRFLSALRTLIPTIILMLSLNAQTAGTASVPLISQLSPSRSESLQAGKKHIEHGKLPEAIQTLEALQAVDNSWEIHFWLGTAYLLQGRHQDAAQSLDHALRLQSEIAEIWVQRAIVEQERGNTDAAIQLLGIAQQIDSHCAKAYLNAAYLYEQTGKYEAARNAYIHFLKLSPQDTLNRHIREHIHSRLVHIPYANHE